MSVGIVVRGALLAGAMAALPAACMAVDAIGVEGGREADEGLGRIGIETQWDWQRTWFAEGDWYLGGLWEVSASYWWGDEGTTGNDWLFDLGLTPVLRFARHSPLLVGTPYLEAGAGPHVASETGIEDEEFDINFSFGSFIGAGVRVGANQQWELGYRFQHLSNAGLGDDNPGFNYHLVRLGYRF